MDRPEMAAGAATNTLLAFITIMPSPSAILECDPAMADDVRINEYAAAAVSLGLGLVLSIVSREKEPFLISLFTTAALVIAVEYLTRTTVNERSASVRPSYL